MPKLRLTPLLSVLLLAACGDASREATPDEAPLADRVPDRPASRSDTILIEGMAEPIETRLYRAPDDFPLAFSIYVPADMGIGELDDPAAVRFHAEFGGVRNDDAFVHVVAYPDPVDEAGALARLRGFEAGPGVPVGPGLEPLAGDAGRPPIPWALRTHRFRYRAGGSWYFGTAALGRHEGRLFHVILHYPAEYGDGFGPRTALMLDTWRWIDGRRLREDTAGG